MTTDHEHIQQAEAAEYFERKDRLLRFAMAKSLARIADALEAQPVEVPSFTVSDVVEPVVDAMQLAVQDGVRVKEAWVDDINELRWSWREKHDEVLSWGWKPLYIRVER